MPPTHEEKMKRLRGGPPINFGVGGGGGGGWGGGGGGGGGGALAAAVVLPQAVLERPELLAGVDDSKALTAPQRERLAKLIVALADEWAVGATPAHVIDTHGILPATLLAMQVALLRLPRPADALLIDAVQIASWP